MNIRKLVPGSILSETSFFIVKGVKPNAIAVVDDYGNDIDIGNEYVEKILSSADIYDKEEKKTMTELADILINSPRIAMTVAFFKKDVAKSKTAYNKEVQEAIDKVRNANLSVVEGMLRNLVENPISKVIPGELRVMKGRHYGSIDDLGRIQFVDMEQTKETGKDYDTRLRQIDPRTIQYIIVGGTKFLLK